MSTLSAPSGYLQCYALLCALSTHANTQGGAVTGALDPRNVQRLSDADLIGSPVRAGRLGQSLRGGRC